MVFEIISGDQVAAAVAAEAANIMIYGAPGVGKTTEAVKAFCVNGRCTAFYAQCEDGALKSILTQGLPLPDTVRNSQTGLPLTIIGWEPLWDILCYVATHRQLYNALIIDTLTTWTASTYAALQAAGFGKGNGWAIPMYIRDRLIDLRNYARQLGVHVIYTAHFRDPYNEDGIFYKGGPSLSPKKASELFYGTVDTMLRADYMSIGGNVQRVYYTGGLDWDKATLGMQPPSVMQWFQKNRENVSQAVIPADLRNYLLARRPPYQGL